MVQPLTTSQSALFYENLNWAYKIAMSAQRKLPASFDLEDLKQLAAIGLIKACRKFDPGQGVPFMGYAYFAVRGEIYMATRRRHYTEATHDDLGHHDKYADPRPGPAEQFEIQRAEQAEGSRLRQVENMAQTLPAEQREVVNGLLLGFAIEELETLLGRPKRSVMKHARRAARAIEDMRSRSEQISEPERQMAAPFAFVPVRPPRLT